MTYAVAVAAPAIRIVAPPAGPVRPRALDGDRAREGDHVDDSAAMAVPARAWVALQDSLALRSLRLGHDGGRSGWTVATTTTTTTTGADR